MMRHIVSVTYTAAPHQKQKHQSTTARLNCPPLSTRNVAQVFQIRRRYTVAHITPILITESGLARSLIGRFYMIALMSAKWRLHGDLKGDSQSIV